LVLDNGIIDDEGMISFDSTEGPMVICTSKEINNYQLSLVDRIYRTTHY